MGSEGLSRIWRRKTVNLPRAAHQLHRHLTAIQLVPIGVGSTIGAGVYVLVGTVAREKVGPALPFSFLIAGIAAALSALCYAELASRCPSAGSAYHYAYTCVGEGLAWMIGWALILEYTVGGSTVARGISPNLAIFFGGVDKLPSWLIRRELNGIVVDPCAGLLVLVVTVLLCIGIRESAAVQTVMTMANVLVLLFVVGAGSYSGFRTGWQGYGQQSGYLPYGVNGVLGGAATLFFAYIGFDTVASTAEEVKNPQSDLPWGIALSLLICSTLYMMVSVVIVGLVPYDMMDPDTPMSSAFSSTGMPWAMYIVTAGAVAALSTTLMGSLLPQPRILMAMARDGLLPRFFSRINRATKVPVNGTLISGLVASVMAFSMDVDQLAGMVSVGTLFAFTIVGVSILILRFAPPEDPVTVTEAAPQQIATSTQAQIAAVEEAPQKQPTFLAMLARRPSYFSPVISLLSESSMSSMPSFLQNFEDSSDSGASSDDESHISDITKISESNLQDPLLPMVSPIPEMTREEARRWAAALGIGSVLVGVLLFSVGFSLDFPRFIKWGMMGFGCLGLLAGIIILSLIEQDEGRHKFGDSGGFQCPWVPVLPVASIFINVYLLVNLEMWTWIRVSVWLALGLFIYAVYGIRHSTMSKETRRIHSGSSQRQRSVRVSQKPAHPVPVPTHRDFRVHNNSDPSGLYDVSFDIRNGLKPTPNSGKASAGEMSSNAKRYHPHYL